ncbi:hypothetical protein RI129_001782 [Pyrocoelia pectoralis]|uniref:MICOS complex subunit MIC13 n=1 Tax=Pyrocoelia pectoralis TaxID=417401 RepID=A0AAN7ZXN8_9COLE
MIKFALKTGIALGTVYYAADQGLWKDSHETLKLYDKMCEAASPYVDQAKGHLPFEIPHLPKSNQTSYIVKQTWNKGVSATCMFLADLPHNISKWTKSGVNLAMSNEEIKKLFSSFGISPAIENKENK